MNNQVNIPTPAPVVDGTASNDPTGSDSTWNWTEIIKSLGQTSVGLAGNTPPQPQSGPAMVFQPARNNSTIWIALVVVLVIGFTIYLVKRGK